MARSSHLSLQKRREQSKRMKRLRADPAFEAKRLAALKQKHADPAFAAANSERMKRRCADPVFEAKRLAALKQKHADPAFQARRLAGCRRAAIERRRQRLGVASVQT
jgi:hypothetical protein